MDINSDTLWATPRTFDDALRNEIINVKSGATLTVAAPIAFRKCEINVMQGGAINVAATSNTDGTMRFNDRSKLNIKQGGIVNLNYRGRMECTDAFGEGPGYIQIDDGATVNVTTGGTFAAGHTTNNGTIIIQQGGKVYTPYISSFHNSGSILVNNGGTFNAELGSVSIKGILTVLKGAHFSIWSSLIMVEGGKIRLEEGAEITGRMQISRGCHMEIAGSSPVNIIHGGELLTIVGSTITISSGAALNVGPNGTFIHRGKLDLLTGGVINLAGTLNSSYTQVASDISSSIFDIAGTCNINSGGALEIDIGTTNINSEGRINVNSGGKLNVVGKETSSPEGPINPLEGIGGRLNINSGGVLSVTSGTSSPINPRPAGIINVTNFGIITIKSSGIVKLNRGLGPVSIPASLTVNSGGTLDILADGLIDLYGMLVIKSGAGLFNRGSINQQCRGKLVTETGSNISGNPISDVCVSFPVTHMSDTTASRGVKIGDGTTTVVGEFVTPTSQLIGDKIDQITLKLRKFGSPTGNATIGVFGSQGGTKKQFTTLDVSTLTTTFEDHKFSLTGGQLYTIEANDRIGISYSGTGSSANGITVMLDTDAADPFDGTSSFAQRYEPGTVAGTGMWRGRDTNDLYVILEQTHG